MDVHRLAVRLVDELQAAGALEEQPPCVHDDDGLPLRALIDVSSPGVLADGKASPGSGSQSFDSRCEQLDAGVRPSSRS